MSGFRMTPSDNTIVHPYYQTAHAQITEPTRFVAISHYYRHRWLRHVGPVGTAILLELRGRCYNNPTTGERRDTVVASQKELAEAIGISVDTLQRHLGKPGRNHDPKANLSLRCFIWTEERYERSEVGRVRQLENVYHVSMDDPIHPDDEEHLKTLVKEYEMQELEATVRREQGKKQILPAQDRVHPKTESTPKRIEVTAKDTHIIPEPQNAVLRVEGAAAPIPEPQNAAGRHRKMRQGSPQNAVRSKESLLLFTKEFTNTTLNVSKTDFAFVSLEEEKASDENPETLLSTEPTKLRNVLEAGLATEVNALIQELRDWGSERRHRQLLSVCERHNLLHLSRQALQATRERLAKETKRGVLEKPGAYYQRVLISLLEAHQVFVPTAGEDDAEEVRRLARQSMGLG